MTRPGVVVHNMSEMDMSETNSSPPLKPAVFHILLALAEEDRHGYAIMQKVREQSGGQIPLQTGSFYRHLSKLIEAGLVGGSGGPHRAGGPA